MKNRRSKKTSYKLNAVPRLTRPQSVKRKETLNCLGRQRQKLIYRVAHRRGC